jgi:two-component system response regulator FlrC
MTSRRGLRGGPFVAINCAAIPDNLLEATLFGHEKGAFTGAQTAQAGKFEQANGGTLLLDEISEMPLGLQAKLLRVLQEREVERVGGKKPVPLDIRILATSNRDMAEPKSRADVSAKISTTASTCSRCEIPALRERPEDIVRFGAQDACASCRGGKPGGKICRRCRSQRCVPTPGRATCANWKTWSSAP